MIIFHHFSVQTLEHSRTQTYKPQPETSAVIRKPIDGDKRISSSLDRSPLRCQIVPLFVVRSFRSSNHTLRSVLCRCSLSSDRFSVLRHQIVPQFFVIRSFLSSLSDRSSVLRHQIVGSSSSLFFIVKSLVFLQFYCCSSTKIES